MSVELCANSFCVSFGNVKSDYSEQFKPYFSLWLLPGKDVYFNMSILTLVVYIFIKYFHFVSLCFHYNYFEEANFSLPILETRGPFLESPGKLTGPKPCFEIKLSRKLGCFWTSNKVHFVSLANNFNV